MTYMFQLEKECYNNKNKTQIFYNILQSRISRLYIYYYEFFYLIPYHFFIIRGYHSIYFSDSIFLKQIKHMCSQ